MTQGERILALLQRQGSATSVELNRISFRYSARIHDLRKKGHVIEAKPIKQGLYRFTLIKEGKICKPQQEQLRQEKPSNVNTEQPRTVEALSMFELEDLEVKRPTQTAGGLH